MPTTTYDTVGVRIDLPPIQEGSVEEVGALHGLEHALMAVAPLIAGCDRQDIGSCWYTMFPDTLAPCVFVFDRTPGGVGLSEKLFESLFLWLKSACQLLRTCDCDGGCPACLYSARCEANNESLSKRGTLAILERLV